MRLLARQLEAMSRTCRINNHFSTFHLKMSPVKVGDKLPPGELYEDSPQKKINITEYIGSDKVLIFGVVGAFTPGCSKTHVPGYIKNREKLITEQNICDIICISVNDPFVMSAWKKDLQADGKIIMLADPTATFVKKLDLTFHLPPLGGIRSKRFSMIVENGTITELNVEPDNTGLTCTLAKKIGKKK